MKGLTLRKLTYCYPLGTLSRIQTAIAKPVKASSAAHSSISGSGGYLTLADKHTLVTKVKKSKFIATGFPVSSVPQALQYIEDSKDPAASHNCFAYKLGNEYRSSDDGEPGGTAGRPILGSIEGEGLDGVCVLVVRYFGGTKLGAGGLVRAYGGAARECLRHAPKAFKKPLIEVQIKAPLESLGTVYQLVEQYKAERLAEEYGESGELMLRLGVEVSALEAFNDALMDATGGRVKAEPGD